MIQMEQYRIKIKKYWLINFFSSIFSPSENNLTDLGKNKLFIEVGINKNSVVIKKTKYILPNASGPKNKLTPHLSICWYSIKKIPETKGIKPKLRMYFICLRSKSNLVGNSLWSVVNTSKTNSKGCITKLISAPYKPK